MDNKFKKLQNLMPILAINTTAAKEHVPEIECKIRLIKEQGRGILNTLQFKKMPRMMLIELIYHIMLSLNAYPTKTGVSETLPPRKIVYQHKLVFAKHCKLPFRTYCEAHREPAPTNSMVAHSTLSIVLGPTGNLQGLYKLFSLVTNQKIKWCVFTPHPMPNLVIKKVEAFGKFNALPSSFDFADRNGILFEWNKEVDKYPVGIVELDNVNLYPSLAAEHPGVVHIQPLTAFLTMRVRSLDEYDWGKVKRVLGYLKGTLHMPLILSADSLMLLQWWVDAVYAMHNNCWGHTGAGMSLEQGMVLSYLWKQKINTKSSTEVKLVGVDNLLGYILWVRYFMQGQGYNMDVSLFYQDNMSAILLETNGKASSSKRSKHIKVKYFYFKDKIDQGKIIVNHCPAGQM